MFCNRDTLCPEKTTQGKTLTEKHHRDDEQRLKKQCL